MTNPSIGFPTYGVRSTTWNDVRKALTVLGGEEKRIATGHNGVVYALPTGDVYTGKPPGKEKRSKLVMKEGVRQLLYTLDKLEVPAPLFLGVLESIGGVTWYQRDDEVERIAHYLRERRPKLSCPEEWAAANKEYAQWVRDQARERVAAQEEGDMEAKEHTFQTPDIISLAGLTMEDPNRKRAVTFIGNNAQRRKGIFERLERKGDMKVIKGGAKFGDRYLFTETGALVVAEEVAKKYASPAPAPAPQAPPAPPEAPVPTPAPPAPPQHVERRGTGSLAALALRLCFHHGVEPVLDGDRINVQGSLERVVSELRPMR